MRVAAIILAGVAGLAAASPAFAGNILWYEDGTVGTSCVAGAIALTPHTYTQYTYATVSSFVSALNAGGVDLVIYGEQNNGSSWGAVNAALTNYVNNGGRVIAASWDSSSGIATLMQATVVSTNVTSMTTTSHPIYANCGSSITLVNPGIGTFSRCYNPVGTATGIGASGSAYGVILGNSGRTLMNAGCMTTYSPITTGQQFIANEINFLITHTLTGRVLYDRYVVDSSGIGNTVQPAVPLAAMRVEARNAAGATAASATTDAQGNFTLVVAGTTGSLVVVAQNSVATLRAVAAGPPLVATFAPSVSFNTDQSLGTFTINEAMDPGGSARAPIDAVRTIKAAYDWAHARSSDTIPPLEVLYDNSSAPTSYTAKNGAVAATMRISGSSANPDGWDVDVIRKTYARHVLGSICADPGIAADSTFDKATAAENAFAEGFGYAFASLMSGSRYYFDGTSATTADYIDLESPVGIQTAKSPSCAAWVAQALYDLLDPANEAWDTVDGTASDGSAPQSERVFTLVDSLSAPVKASTFYSAWLAKGYDPAGISRDFVHHGLLADDPDEPNDTPDQATQIGQFGFVVNNHTLNISNDDWYAFTLPYQTDAVTAVVSYNRVTYASATLFVEITTATGATLAIGTAADTTSPYKAVTGVLNAGKYLVHVALATGGPLPNYSVQAFSTLKFRSDTFPTWTVGQPYSVSVNIVGGIPPYGLTIPAPYQGPQGLTFDGATGIVSGVPTGPPDGFKGALTREYSFLLNAVDGASPSNSASKLITFVLNDQVRSRFAEFVAFAQGKPYDRAWPPVGGTPPYVVAIDPAFLPSGLSVVDGARLAFKGTPGAAGGYPFSMKTFDYAASSATTTTTAVVCVPVGPVDLTSGKSACGYYFDLVKDASVGFAITTVKKKPVRSLRVAVYDVDGMTPLSVAAKIAKGKITFTKFAAPTSGRYYCIVASDDVLDATSFTCVQKTTAAKAGKGDAGTFSFGGDDQLEVPMGVLNGGTIALTVKPDRKSGLRVRVVALKNPKGQTVAVSETDVKVVAKTGQLTLTKTVDASGTWTVVLGAMAGPSGTFTYSYKLKQPKNVNYSAD